MSKKMYIDKEMNIYYDFGKYCLYVNGKEVDQYLTPTASKVLEVLAENAPNFITANTILENTDRHDCNDVAARNDIKTIRDYMRKYGIHTVINTKRGAGYSCSYGIESGSKKDSSKMMSFISPEEYCLSHGIIGFFDKGIDLTPFMKDKSEIYVVTTTGRNLITEGWAQDGFLLSKLIEGANFYFLIANKNSELSNDITSIEEYRYNLSSQFEDIIESLRNVVEEAYACSDRNIIGKIYLGCCFSLLRQTITLGVADNHQAWGWLSLTLPPGIAKSGTPSFAFEGDIHTKHTIAYDTHHHIQVLIKEARDKREGTWIEITPEINPKTYYFRSRCRNGQQSDARKDWEQKVEKAQQNMKLCQNLHNLLIEVASLHPLNPDGTPGMEFRLRLDYAVELYRNLKIENPDRQIHIYVPGSVHKPDTISLSDAGKEYLIQCGIAEKDILGDEKNCEYKGIQGVYNSADECYVSAQIFRNGSYRLVYSVCSPHQFVRKTLFYIQFGVIPILHTVPLNPNEFQTSPHDFLYEIFDALPDILYRDHDWQDPDSLDAIRTRKERKP